MSRQYKVLTAQEKKDCALCQFPIQKGEEYAMYSFSLATAKPVHPACRDERMKKIKTRGDQCQVR